MHDTRTLERFWQSMTLSRPFETTKHAMAKVTWQLSRETLGTDNFGGNVLCRFEGWGKSHGLPKAFECARIVHLVIFTDRLAKQKQCWQLKSLGFIVISRNPPRAF